MSVHGVALSANRRPPSDRIACRRALAWGLRVGGNRIAAAPETGGAVEPKIRLSGWGGKGGAHENADCATPPLPAPKSPKV